MSETYLIVCLDYKNLHIAQESALTNPAPHTYIFPFHSAISFTGRLIPTCSAKTSCSFLESSQNRADRARGTDGYEAGAKQTATAAQDERNRNHRQMFPTSTKTRCCSPGIRKSWWVARETGAVPSQSFFTCSRTRRTSASL